MHRDMGRTKSRAARAAASDGRKKQARVGLARALSKLGYCSRSVARTLIAEGRVRVDGKVKRDPEAPVLLQRNLIEVDGQLVTSAPRVYLMLNKPRGLVTTAADERQRGTVYDCLAGAKLPFVSPVGRLDKESEGLLLFTNDHAWAAGLLDPASAVWRTYRVEVKGEVQAGQLRLMRAGVRAVHEEVLSVRRVRVIGRQGGSTELEVVLDEGKNRHIRRLLSALGLEVQRLVRVALGPLRLGELKPGQWRHLTRGEVHTLAKAIAPHLREGLFE
ncbi:MAG: pseudouridine synthase [bacterium]|jgi:23S rRNA pseudouridine2605 synthase|nr:rRNA pseudouridine synthase [candidate division KSB1 bacterium]MDH7559791.1 pseudouridine synthase [bacterium]